MDEYGTDLDLDSRQAMMLLADLAPIVAETVESGEAGLHVITRGVFGVDIRPGKAYRVIVDIHEGTVTHDGKAV